MTQEKANRIFETELGQQLISIFVTSDERVFIRHEEALSHANGTLDKDTLPLADKNVVEWFPEN